MEIYEIPIVQYVDGDRYHIGNVKVHISEDGSLNLINIPPSIGEYTLAERSDVSFMETEPWQRFEVVVKNIPPEPVDTNTFMEDLRHIINKHSLENISNTPDYVLAAYLQNCLVDLNHAVNARDRHMKGA